MKKIVEIDGGKILEPNRTKLKNYIWSLTNGQYSFDINKIFDKRTKPQNATLYMWATIIADESGESVESIKKHIMQQNGFGKWCTVKRRGLNGEIIECNEFARWSTAKLDKRDFMKIMKTIQELAEWYGIILPEVGELT